jgi:hypothetical protein
MFNFVVSIGDLNKSSFLMIGQPTLGQQRRYHHPWLFLPHLLMILLRTYLHPGIITGTTLLSQEVRDRDDIVAVTTTVPMFVFPIRSFPHS